MKTTQISPSVESHTEEPLWQEFTEQEQEKICGGRWTQWKNVSRWQDVLMRQVVEKRVWNGKGKCFVEYRTTHLKPWSEVGR